MQGTCRSSDLLGTVWLTARATQRAGLEEVRRHLGVETQRQWSEAAIRRATPDLLGPFSLVTLVAQQRLGTPPVQCGWPPGIASRSRPSPTPWPSSDAGCGRTELSSCPPRTAMS
jgi:hypothetical protein